MISRLLQRCKIRTIATNTMPENRLRSGELRQRSGFPISRKSRALRPRKHQGQQFRLAAAPSVAAPGRSTRGKSDRRCPKSNAGAATSGQAANSRSGNRHRPAPEHQCPTPLCTVGLTTPVCLALVAFPHLVGSLPPGQRTDRGSVSLPRVRRIARQPLFPASPSLPVQA